MNVFLTSTEPALEPHRQQIEAMLARRGGGRYTVRRAPEAPAPEARAAALQDTDVVVCLLGDSNLPELPDGSGYAETEVATALRMGKRVLAYRCEDATGGATADGPLHAYRIARARRFRRMLREQVGVQRVATMDDLLSNVDSDLGAIRTDTEEADVAPSVIRRIHSRLQDRTGVTYDAFTISLHNMDVLYRLEDIAPSREEYVDPPTRAPGGGGANVVHALARLGVQTGVAGAVGADPDGAALRADLARAGVNTDLLLELSSDDAPPTGHSTILNDAHGHRTIFTELGANTRLAAELVDRGLRPRLQQALSRSRIVLFTAFPSAAEREFQESLLESLPAETVVAFTPGSLYASPGISRLAPIIIRTNVIFLSEEALNRLAGDLVPQSSEESPSIAQKAHALLQWRYDLGSREPMIIVVRRRWREYGARSGLQHVTLCWGMKGYDGIAEPDGRPSRDDLDQLVDGTGTGGALAAGVLYGLLRSRPPEDCANLGYVMAMSAATGFGARVTVPSRDELSRRWCQWLKVESAPAWL